ncbi:hypothetical protein Tco_0682373 [Tanacetum coccineum]|uniref:Uncharacterized protein n=1 Tax=Tanacetum coccineum TaxID=301880 RepID=A0ABQ4XSC5_9ASTR
MLNNKEVLTKSSNVPVNTAKQSSSRAAVSNSTARYVNTAATRPIVNDAKPCSNVFHKSHSSVKRTIYQRTAPKNSVFKEKVNTAKVNNVTTVGTKAVVSAIQGQEEKAVKSSACWIWRPTGKVIDHISKDSGSYTPKRFDYVTTRHTFKSVMLGPKKLFSILMQKGIDMIMNAARNDTRRTMMIPKDIQDFTPMDSEKEAQKPEEEEAEYEKEKEELRLVQERFQDHPLKGHDLVL